MPTPDQVDPRSHRLQDAGGAGTGPPGITCTFPTLTGTTPTRSCTHPPAEASALAHSTYPDQ